jgi:nucleotide-binding universal stress UspA family protein
MENSMFKKLLVPLDHSPLAEQALGPAAEIARASQAEIDVVMVHQPTPFAGFADAPWSSEQAIAEEYYLESIAGELETGASVSATHSLLHGNVLEIIDKRAHDVGADLIVMTSHGRTGLSRAWLGSVADAVLRRSTIPVLMLRPVETKVDRLAAHHLFRRILVPLDGSALSKAILSSASDLASCGKSRVVLLRVVQPVPLVMPNTGAPFVYSTAMEDEVATTSLKDEAIKELGEVKRTLEKQGLTDIESHVIVARHIAPAIIDYARDHGVDAIAMSTQGRGASRLLVGSVADKVLRSSGLPILLLRPVSSSVESDFVVLESITEQLPALAHV